MDRFINTITDTISTLFGKICQGHVVVSVAVRVKACFCTRGLLGCAIRRDV